MTERNKYKVKLECSGDHKDKFQTSKCMLIISVGQEEHEDEKFRATLEQVNKFSYCLICVDDTLQRHTIGMLNGKSADEMLELSTIEGDNWIKRNKKSISNLKIPYRIIRWDEWINGKDYIINKSLVDDFYLCNSDFREAVKHVSNSFVSRLSRRYQGISQLDYETAILMCKDYLLEECAVYCSRINSEYKFEIYPWRRNKVYAHIVKNFTSDRDSECMQRITLNFRNHKTSKELNTSDEM